MQSRGRAARQRATGGRPPGGFADHGERAVATFSRRKSRAGGATNDAVSDRRTIAAASGDAAIFVRILAKLNFFKFGEILPLILFDYAEKRADTTNASFKRA
jgi:hypothetical protein